MHSRLPIALNAGNFRVFTGSTQKALLPESLAFDTHAAG